MRHCPCVAVLGNSTSPKHVSLNVDIYIYTFFKNYNISSKIFLVYYELLR